MCLLQICLRGRYALGYRTHFLKYVIFIGQFILLHCLVLHDYDAGHATLLHQKCMNSLYQRCGCLGFMLEPKEVVLYVSMGNNTTSINILSEEKIIGRVKKILTKIFRRIRFAGLGCLTFLITCTYASYDCTSEAIRPVNSGRIVMHPRDASCVQLGDILRKTRSGLNL